MQHNVNPEKIKHIVTHLTSVLNQGNYETSDVLLAASELLGRIIVNTCDTPVSGVQMAEVMENHIRRTLQAGFTAKGYSMGPMEL